jgi:long-chain acyl-CoA synthetase
VKHADVSTLIRAEIDAQSGNLADFEKIRKFVLLPEAFSSTNGELTPTLKVKRRVVAEKYGSLVGGE